MILTIVKQTVFHRLRLAQFSALVTIHVALCDADANGHVRQIEQDRRLHMRPKKIYYWVSALRDHTILAALEKRKQGATKTRRAPRVDPEGIYYWSFDTAKDFRHLTEAQCAARHTTIATCLNIRRIVRERIERRLDDLNRTVTALTEQLARLTAPADRLGLPGTACMPDLPVTPNQHRCAGSRNGCRTSSRRQKDLQ